MLVYLLNMCLSWRGRHLPGDDSFAGGEHHEEHLFGGIRVPSPYFNLQSRHLIHFFLWNVSLGVWFFSSSSSLIPWRRQEEESSSHMRLWTNFPFWCLRRLCVHPPLVWIYISLFGLSSASSLKERTVFWLRFVCIKRCLSSTYPTVQFSFFIFFVLTRTWRDINGIACSKILFSW